MAPLTWTLEQALRSQRPHCIASPQATDTRVTRCNPTSSDGACSSNQFAASWLATILATRDDLPGSCQDSRHQSPKNAQAALRIAVSPDYPPRECSVPSAIVVAGCERANPDVFPPASWAGRR